MVALHVSWRYVSGAKPGLAPDAAELVPELHKYTSLTDDDDDDDDSVVF